MSEELKPNAQPPVIVIDSYDDDDDDGETKETGDNNGNEDSNNLKQNDNGNSSSSQSSLDLQVDEIKTDLECDNSTTDKYSGTNSFPQSPDSLQVPTSMQVPLKSSINIADLPSVTDDSLKVSPSGASSSTNQRTEHITINFNRKENGVLKSLSRHSSRESLREEDLKHLKEEVCVIGHFPHTDN